MFKSLNMFLKKIFTIISVVCIIIIINIVLMGEIMLLMLCEKANLSKTSSGITATKNVYSLINIRIDENFKNFSLDDTTIFFDTSDYIIQVNNTSIDLTELLEQYPPSHYFVAVIKDNTLQYVLYSKQPIQETQVKKYSEEEQKKLYQDYFKQDISCYPYE